MPTIITRGAGSAVGFGLFGTVAAATDPYFNYNTLLLPGNGTNGAQNNTFLDSSSNNFTITRNGDTTQGTFSPFSQTGWSNLFDGSSDYLSLAGSSGWRFTSTTSFTVEMWLYVTSTNVGVLAAYASPGGWVIGIGTDSGTGTFNVFDGVAWQAGYGPDIRNQWTHCVFTSNAGSAALFVNGSRTRTWTLPAGIDPGSDPALSIGAYTNASSPWYTGYISNLRIVKGSYVYDPASTTITVPTAPLTAVTNTTLLTCQSNRFIDANTQVAAKTITVNGDGVSVQAFSPFNPTAAYSAATNGGSGYFDGTGDYLSFPAVSVGTSAFTFECWVYTSAANTLQLTFGAPNTNPTGGLSIQLLSNGTTVQLDSYVVSNQQFTIPTRTAQSWNHLAVCRDGSNNCTVFWNGTRSSTGSVTNTTDYSGGFGNIGANSGSVNFTGYISGARAVIGSTVYDPTQSSITVPTSPPTAVSNTKLLLNFTNAGIIDNSTKNDLVTVGNAQISTAQSKFGGGSMYFDGTGDFVRTFASNQDLAFRTGNFTVECWVYFNASGQNGILQLSPNPGGFNESTENSIAMQRSLTGQWQIYANSTNPTASATINQSQWYHLAIVRNGTTTTFYVDGTSTITVASDSTDYTGTYIGLGAIYSTSYPLNGYIDDLRITKGIARYTSNFTPPTAAFPLQ